MARDKIFISYRREDSEAHARTLRDSLAKALKDTDVFLDVSKMEPGSDFEESIRKELDNCTAVVAVIGNSWATVETPEGARRLDDTEDLLSLELGTALQAGTLVIPVLVDGATMPPRDKLPDSLKKLARLHAIAIDPYWKYDIRKVAEVIDRSSSARSVAKRISPLWALPAAALAAVAIWLLVPTGPKVIPSLPSLAVAEEEHLLAVLQFEDMTTADVPERFTKARKLLQVGLITSLNGIPGIKTFSPILFEAVSGGEKIFEEASKKGATRLINGTVEFQPNGRLEVNAWVTDTRDKTLLASLDAPVVGHKDQISDLSQQLTNLIAIQLANSGLQIALPINKPTTGTQTATSRVATTRAMESILMFEDDDEELDDAEPQAHGRPAGSFNRALSMLARLADNRAHAQEVEVEPTDGEESGENEAGKELTQEEEIRGKIAEYCEALQKGDLDTIAVARGKLSDRQRAGLASYFENAEDLVVQCEDIDIYPIDEKLYAVSYLRRDEFKDKRTGEEVNVEVRLENAVVWDNNRWLIKSKKLLADRS